MTTITKEALPEELAKGGVRLLIHTACSLPAFNEIDVDALAGDPVKTLIKYTGMARNVRVQVR